MVERIGMMLRNRRPKSGYIKSLHEYESQLQKYERVECEKCGKQKQHYECSLHHREEGKYAAFCEYCQHYTCYREAAILLVSRTESCGEQEKEVDDSTYYLHGRACNCRFCDHCVERLGVELREKVRDVVKQWKAPMMWTLTIDQELFDTPRDAFDHVRAKRCISELVRSLKNLGYLIDKHYFAVIEWHKEGWPHWHLLVNARYVPHDVVLERWGKFRPKYLEPARHADGCECRACDGDAETVKLRPEFGAVRFSAPSGMSGEHAAHYATKYLLKPQEHPYPDWVTEAEGIKVARYQASRGFFGPPDRRTFKKEGERAPDWNETYAGKTLETQHHDTCFCETCRTGESGTDAAEFPYKPKRTHRTIKVRVADCGQTCVILRKYFDIDRWTFRYVGSCVMPTPEAMELLNVDSSLRSTSVESHWARYLMGRTKAPPDDVSEFMGTFDDVIERQIQMF